MISSAEILQTVRMFDQQHLDIRTITMGVSLLDCAHPDPRTACNKIYDKICRRAGHLVSTGEAIGKEFGIPIVNKRVAVTPISLVAAASDTADYVPFAKALDKAAKAAELFAGDQLDEAMNLYSVGKKKRGGRKGRRTEEKPEGQTEEKSSQAHEKKEEQAGGKGRRTEELTREVSS